MRDGEGDRDNTVNAKRMFALSNGNAPVLEGFQMCFNLHLMTTLDPLPSKSHTYVISHMSAGSPQETQTVEGTCRSGTGKFSALAR